jgi:SAM-dependent methyltransferase
MKSTSVMDQRVKTGGYEKSRDRFLAVFLRHLESCNIHSNEKVLVIGGSRQDAELLLDVGFKDVILSNFNSELDGESYANLGVKLQLLAIDAEQIALLDGSFDFVFAHEVLHHCRSPHRALCEMLRVARKHVVLLEPNDSFLMRLLVWMRFSFPYEIFSVVYHERKAGGVRDTCIPNFIYRWSANEVRKTVSSYLAEYTSVVHAHPYWDFDVGEEGLSVRKETRIHAITSIIGATRFLTLLKALEMILNLIPFLRRQGNKFYCCIEKTGHLKPWLTERDDKITFNPDFRSLSAAGIPNPGISDPACVLPSGFLGASSSPSLSQKARKMGRAKTSATNGGCHRRML